MSQRNSYSVIVQGEKGQRVTLSISGRVTIDHLRDLMPRLQGILAQRAPSELEVDLAGLEYIDSSGAMALRMLEDRARAASIPFRFVHVESKVQSILGLLQGEALSESPLVPPEKPSRAMEQVGEGSLRLAQDVVQVLTFVGELLRGLVHALSHPRSVRWNEVLFYMERAGVDGLPIVGLISFLLGLIMAFMTSLQLRQFGANVYVAPLVALAMVRELGPIMTAILVAGRSGSAFAAEIGTMVVNEEVDALTVMGFDPVRFLAVPKVLAAMATVPLLTIFADLFAILGGMVVGVLGLNLTIYTYVEETMRAIRLFDVVAGVVKSLVFAMLIAGIGCQRGFQVRGGAQAVGIATTSAVVAAMFLIIVADSAFAIVLHYIS